jgi:hypothetical protein
MAIEKVHFLCGWYHHGFSGLVNRRKDDERREAHAQQNARPGENIVDVRFQDLLGG